MVLHFFFENRENVDSKEDERLFEEELGEELQERRLAMSAACKVEKW